MNLPWKSNDIKHKKYSSSSSLYKNKNEIFFSLEDNRECITIFFKYVNEECKKSENKRKFLFCISQDINWIVNLNEGAEFILLKSLEKQQILFDCVITIDSYSMTKLARGVLKPMSAILGGQLKIDGNTDTFGELTPVLKSSVKLMMEYNKTNFNLDVSF